MPEAVVVAEGVHFDIEPRVIVPTRPVIRYVRVELLDTATIFRVFWDIFLALFMAALGAAWSLSRPIGTMHRAFLWVTGLAAIVFLALDVLWMIRARREV
jgi:hypothetical protein